MSTVAQPGVPRSATHEAAVPRDCAAFLSPGQTWCTALGLSQNLLCGHPQQASHIPSGHVDGPLGQVALHNVGYCSLQSLLRLIALQHDGDAAEARDCSATPATGGRGAAIRRVKTGTSAAAQLARSRTYR